MKIVIYTHAFAPLIGGAETIVMSLARGLARLHPVGTAKPADITLITATPAGDMDDAALGFRVVRRPGMGRLLKLMREADIVHLAGPALLPLFLAWLIRKPAIVEHHGFQAACPNGQLLFEPDQSPCPGHFMAGRHRKCLRCNAKLGSIASFKMWLLTFPRRLLCEMISANVAPTQWLSTVLQLPRTTTIHHGLRPVTERPGPEDAAGPPAFVFLGRLVGTKGAHILIAAAGRLKQQGYVFRVKIIGDGPGREILQRDVARSGLDGFVEFAGYLPDEDVEVALHHAVAVVMPSLAGEVFGLVAAENMLRGRLVIASDIGALREVVGDAGLLFPPGDEVALMHRMQQVLESAPQAAALRRRAAERATSLFDEELMIRRHLALYGTVAPCEQ